MNREVNKAEARPKNGASTSRLGMRAPTEFVLCRRGSLPGKTRHWNGPSFLSLAPSHFLPGRWSSSIFWTSDFKSAWRICVTSGSKGYGTRSNAHTSSLLMGMCGKGTFSPVRNSVASSAHSVRNSNNFVKWVDISKRCRLDSRVGQLWIRQSDLQPDNLRCTNHCSHHQQQTLVICFGAPKLLSRTQSCACAGKTLGLHLEIQCWINSLWSEPSERF